MKLFLQSIVFLCVATFSSLASAQQSQLFWVGSSTGDFNTSQNWNTSEDGTGASGIPSSTTLASIYPDNFFTDSPFVINITMSQSNTVLGLQVSHVVEFFGNTSEGTVTLSGPNTTTLTVTGTATAGTGLFVNGDMIVDAGTTLINSGGNLHVNNGVIVIGDAYNSNNGFNTFNGPGTFNIESGTFSFDPAAGSATEMDLGNGGGATGTVTQGLAATASNLATSSIAVTGNILNIGYGGGTGNWTVANGSTLETGTQAGVTYVIALGANNTETGFFGAGTGSGSTGTLTINDTSSLIINSGASLQLGTIATVLPPNSPLSVLGATGGTGTINQNGSSTVDIKGTANLEIGAAVDGLGTYNLNGGSLNIGTTATDTTTVMLGLGADSKGILNQTGGGLTALAATTFDIGEAGIGIYNLAGGSADFKNGFIVGDQAGSTGTVTQSGSSTLTSEGAVTVGNFGVGTYNMSGGTSTFSSTLTIGTNGTLNVNAGTLNIGAASLIGTGNLNFGGGTLNFTSGTTFVDSFGGGNLTANTSTINASSFTGANTVSFDNALTGAGGIAFIGNGATVFTFASNNNPLSAATNSYAGATGITAGTLNAVGADVQSSSALAIGTNGTLNLALAAGGLAYGGVLSSTDNTGILNVTFTNAAGDALVINNAATYTGSTNLGGGGHAGTLQVYNGTFGSISGAGSGVTIGGAQLVALPVLSIPNTGVVNFVGTNTYTGLTTVSSGFTLNATNLDGDATVDGPAAPLSGGVLNVTGVGGIAGNLTNSGTVNVTSAAGIGGNVINNATGTLNATTIGTTAANTVNNAGILTTASIAGDVTNSGTLGSNIALPSVVGTPTLTIGGTLNSTGTLTVRVSGPNSDLYTVTGPTTLSGSINVTGSTAVGTQMLTVLTDPAGATNNGLVATGATALFSASMITPTTGNTSTSVTIETTQIAIAAYIAPNGATPNELAVANAIDGTTTNVLKNIFDSIPAGPGAAPLMLTLTEELSPERLQYARNIAFENSTFMAERMNSVCADLRGGYGGLDMSSINVVTPGFESGMGRSLGSLLAYNDPSFHSSAPNGVNYYPGGQSSGSPSSPPPTPTWDSSNQVISDSPSPNPYMANQNPSGPETPRMSEFIGGDVILADLNQNAGSANAPSSKASYTAGDATAGVSFRVTNHFAAGVLFDYNHTDADIDNNGSKTTVDTYSPGVFATYFDHGFYANGLASFGWNNYKNTLNNNFPGASSTSTSKPSGQQYVGDLDLGYDFHPAKNWTVGPTLGLTYTHLDIDSFTETGGAATGSDLAVNSQSVDSLRSRLGGHVIFQTNTGDVLLQPNFTAMWQHEYLDNNTAITSSLTDINSGSFTINTPTASKDSALIGVGLTASLSNSMALYLNYLADVGADDYWAQSVVGGFKARF